MSQEVFLNGSILVFRTGEQPLGRIAQDVNNSSRFAQVMLLGPWSLFNLALLVLLRYVIRLRPELELTDLEWIL